MIVTEIRLVIILLLLLLLLLLLFSLYSLLCFNSPSGLKLITSLVKVYSQVLFI